MSDQIIFDVDGLIEAQIRQRDKDYAKVCWILFQTVCLR